MDKYITKSFKETQSLGVKIARKILSLNGKDSAVVLALSGNLGGGKTTFLQGFAKGLGIKEKILSPTFVILKRFKIKNSKFTNLYHIDCYRLKNYKNILELDFKEIINPPAGGPKNIIAIEWSEKIKKVLPKNAIKIKFKFIDETTREIWYNKL